MADANAQAIADNAGKPRSITVDGRNVTQHSIQDQIAADRYRRQVNATGARGVLGGVVRRQKLIPPGGA